MNALLTNGILWAQDHSEEPAESFTAQYADPFDFNLELFTESYRERKEHEVYLALLRMVPGLEERLMTGDTDTLQSVAMLVSRSCLYHRLLAIQAFNSSCKRVPQGQGQTIQKV